MLYAIHRKPMITSARIYRALNNAAHGFLRVAYEKRGITKEAITAILLAICLLLSGCGGKATFDGSKTSDETGFRMEYSILDKEESAELELTEGNQIQVHISHTAGNVDVIVGQNSEDPIYKGTGQENADFILTVPKTGCYHISVAGHRAKGEISFTCIPLKEE